MNRRQLGKGHLGLGVLLRDREGEPLVGLDPITLDADAVATGRFLRHAVLK